VGRNLRQRVLAPIIKSFVTPLAKVNIGQKIRRKKDRKSHIRKKGINKK
jgi:hypothetical protein